MIPDVKTYVSGPIEYFERPGHNGPVLVLLHGIGSNASSFAPLFAHLPSDWRVLAWNAPGYGASQPLAPDWPLATDYAEALAGLFDRLALGPVVLVGHSLGALIGAAFARSFPDRVAQLLLASPALGHGATPGGALSQAAQARLDDLDRLGAKAFARARAPRLVAAPDAHPELIDRVTDAMAQIHMPGYGQAVRMLASGSLLDDIAKLSCRTEILVGSEDIITPPEAARRAYAALPVAARGEYHELADAGHAIYQQKPAEFVRVLERFIQPEIRQPNPEGMKP